MGQRGERAANRFVLVSVWLAATVVTGVVAWTAVTRLGDEATATTQAPLSQSDVRRELSQVPKVPTASLQPPSKPGKSSTSDPAPGSAPPPQSGQRPARHFASWTVTGGRLGATCRGAAIRLAYATPADGWEMRMNDSGPDKVNVEFFRGDADTKVEASCRSGIPVKQSESDAGHD